MLANEVLLLIHSLGPVVFAPGFPRATALWASFSWHSFIFLNLCIGLPTVENLGTGLRGASSLKTVILYETWAGERITNRTLSA